MYRFITGKEPKTIDIVKQVPVILDGKISGFEDEAPTNVGGAMLAVFRVSPTTGERLGDPVHRQTTAEDGLWGPCRAESDANYALCPRRQTIL
jgi:Lipase C-terminal domain